MDVLTIKHNDHVGDNVDVRVFNKQPLTIVYIESGECAFNLNLENSN